MDYNNWLKINNLCKKVLVLFLFLKAWRKQVLMTNNSSQCKLNDNKVVLIPNKTQKHSASHWTTIYCKLYTFLPRGEKTYSSTEKANSHHNIGKPHRNASSYTILRRMKEKLLAVEINITCSKLTAVEQLPAVN